MRSLHPASSDLLSAFVGGAPVGVAIVDRDLRYVYVNERLAALNRMPIEAHAGRAVREVLPQAQADEVEPLIRSVFATGEPLLDLERSQPDPASPGRFRHWNCCLIPIRSDGRILAIGALIVETTREKEHEGERHRLEAQLRQAQRLESLGRLAGGIAHDFNNLLTAILGYAELLVEDPGTPAPVKEDVGEIHKAATSAAGLTRQLLAFSRQQVLQPRAISLNGVVGNVESILRRVLGEDITLTTRLASPLSEVMADPAQLDQVVMNLAVNARDAMPSGGALTITTANTVLDEAFVAAHQGASAGAHVMLEIADTGHGMDESVRSRVFEPFFTTKEKGKGTGLGLSMVYGAIKQMGGSIWVESAPGRGTTFTIFLPATAAASEPGRAEPAAASVAGTETVLLVEDQEEVRRITAQILVRHGYRVIEASGPREALRIAGARAVDLLLTDVIMPGMSGRRLAHLLRAAMPHLRVVYMSGYTDDAIVRHGVLDTGLVFVQKPFTPPALLDKIRFALDAADPPGI